MSKWLISFILVLALVLVGMANAADPDLVAHWKLDDGSGTTAVDSSGNGNDGTFVGDPQWASGILGGALDFDGDGDYVDCGNDEIFGITDAFSLTLWINWREAGPEWQTVIAKGDNTWRIARGALTQTMDFGFDDGTRSWAAARTASDVPFNEWHHVTATIDTIEGAKIYLDGVLEGTNTDTGGISTGGTNYPVLIGENAQATGRFWNGLIDDVRVYKRVLTEGEILAVMAGGGAEYPVASSPVPKDGTYHPDTWVNLSWRAGDYAASHDVYIGDNFEDVDSGAESTFIGNQADTFLVAGFPGFPFPDGLVPGTTYYWRIDEVNEAEPNSPWKGDIWSFTIPPKTAYLPVPSDGAESVGIDDPLSWTPGFGAKLHTVYFGETFDEVDSAAGGSPQGTATYSPGTLKMAKTYYWRVDEFDVVETHKGDVWSFTTEGAVAALNPANGAVDVSQTPVLTWAPGLGATYDIFFGTDAGALEQKGSGNLGEESYEPGQLEWNTTYYWRIDEANNANADSPWTGPTWSFTTADFLIVDDMEAYNDLDPADPLSNRIFNAWLDGFGDTTNGSLVGYNQAPFAEQTIVHSGSQSMPMSYDNSAAAKSEATLTLTSNRDWTVNGVETMTIWFRGVSSNAAEQMYVILNGTARVDCDIPDAATVTEWTAWNIPLSSFSDQGVNLSNVNSITIGLGSVTGGTGMMYFDDIRLHPPAQ